MVTLPMQFTATKYPGYFWNMKTATLYTMKSPAGVLRELPLQHPNHFNWLKEKGYVVSHHGSRRFLSLRDLKQLPLDDSEIPVIFKQGVVG